jgi:hypothetical protein
MLLLLEYTFLIKHNGIITFYFAKMRYFLRNRWLPWISALAALEALVKLNPCLSTTALSTTAIATVQA